jgi:hypothetical protein
MMICRFFKNLLSIQNSYTLSFQFLTAIFDALKNTCHRV